MGNALCCANDLDDQVVTVGELKKPQLFGNVHEESDNESD